MFLFSSTELILVFITLCMLVISWIRWRKKKLKIFQELRIPGPSPNFVFGNILEINRKGLLQCQEEWVKKYGLIVGYYHGLKPILLVADRNVLKRIFIKDFHLFSERPDAVPLRVHSFLDNIIPTWDIMDSVLPNQNGEQWKTVRTRISPVFSANKLKMMIPFVDKVSEVTMSILEENAVRGKITDIYLLMRCLIFDVICAQAFALNTNVQREGEENPLFRSVKTIFDNSIYSKIITFSLCFPEMSLLGMIMNFLRMFFANGFSIPTIKICNFIGKVIEERRKNPELRKPDILQSLIDASDMEVPDIQEPVANDKDTVRSNVHNNGGLLKPKPKLTDTEIKATSLVVLLAGFESTSSSVSYFIHMLAKYPEYQTKIQREVDHVLKDNNLDYYSINKMPLLERFMMETLRFYPPAINSVLRIASEDVDFGCIRIPKGMEITVPISYVHFSEDNWENPKAFDPDRFLLEKRSLSHATNYWAFGNGPRNCIGMRLANITSKVILTRMLQKFTFELPENPDEATLSVKVAFGTFVPVNKVLIKVQKRERYSQREKNKT